MNLDNLKKFSDKINTRVGELTEEERNMAARGYFVERMKRAIEELIDIDTEIKKGEDWSNYGYSVVQEELKEEKVFDEKIFGKFYDDATQGKLDMREVNEFFDYLREQNGERKWQQ